MRRPEMPTGTISAVNRLQIPKVGLARTPGKAVRIKRGMCSPPMPPHRAEHWCFPPRDAALHGSLSAVAIFGFKELGDSFSDYGFNYEDLVANAPGRVASYWRYRNPGLARKVDFRWEVGMDPQQTDFTTDYKNSKYLLAFKLNGFERFNKGI